MQQWYINSFLLSKYHHVLTKNDPFEWDRKHLRICLNWCKPKNYNQLDKAISAGRRNSILDFEVVGNCDNSGWLEFSTGIIIDSYLMCLDVNHSWPMAHVIVVFLNTNFNQSSVYIKQCGGRPNDYSPGFHIYECIMWDTELCDNFNKS